MPKLETGGYEAPLSPRKKTARRINVRLKATDLILPTIGFFISKVKLILQMTPFGFAFFSAAYNGRLLAPLLIFVGVALGNLSGMLQFPVKYALANVLFVALFHLKKGLFLKNSYFSALLASACLFFCGMYYVALDGFLLYDIFSLLLESLMVFAGVLVFKKVIPVVRNVRIRRKLSREEGLSVLVLTALVAAGLGHIDLPFFATLQGTFAIYVVLVTSVCFGVGFACPCAIAMGFLTGTSGSQLQAMLAAYCLGGLLSGIFGRYGKVASGMAFLLGSVLLSLCLGTRIGAAINPLDVLLALTLLLFTPKKVLVRVEQMVSESGKERVYDSALKDVLLKKLQAVSDSFFKLSLTFKEHVRSNKPKNMEDASFIFDAASEQICQNCGKRFTCWEKNSISTYNAMVNLMEVLERRGSIALEDVPSHFKTSCVRIEAFLAQVNREYEVNKVDFLWKSRMAQSKKLVTGQLLEISKIIANVKSSIEGESVCEPELQQEVLTALDRIGIRAKSALVLQQNSSFFVEFTLTQELSEALSLKAAVALSNVLERRMMLEEIRKEDDVLRYSYAPQERYCIRSGAAQRCRTGETDCGDSYTFLRLPGGRFLCALSDGMGSGSSAKSESRTTIALLENFLRSGFFRDTAIKMINSVTSLADDNESYSTIDLALVDLNTLRTEFIKTGAVFSLIKSGDSVRKVDAATLPVGILENADFEVTKVQLQNGDFIVLLSDGILGEDPKGLWLKSYLAAMEPCPPRTMAERILERACEKNPTAEQDDMSVLVLRVEESAAQFSAAQHSA